MVVWSNLTGGLFDLYEIVPGFALASLAIVLITRFKPETASGILDLFDEVRGLSSNSEK